MDDYDIHCRHIGVRDLATGQLVATTRLLDHQAASSLGRFYSEEEFSLHGLLQLQGPIPSWAVPASTRPIAMAAPLPCSGASSPKCSTKAATTT